MISTVTRLNDHVSISGGRIVFDHLHTLYAIAKPLLARYGTADECGQGNCNLITDLRDDAIFGFTAEMLHRAAVDSSFGDNAPAIDYSTIENVAIEFGMSISVTFRICFFTETLGHSDSPAQLSIASESSSTQAYRVDYGCGLLDDRRRFAYPRTDKYRGRHDTPPSSDHEWAYFLSKRYSIGLSSFTR